MEGRIRPFLKTVADRMVEKLGLGGQELISWGGACRTNKVFTREIGNKKMNRNMWEEEIKVVTMGGDYDLAFTDGGREDRGRMDHLEPALRRQHTGRLQREGMTPFTGRRAGSRLQFRRTRPPRTAVA